MKFIVVGWPSLRLGKLRLYEEMVFGARWPPFSRRQYHDAGPAGAGEDGAVGSL
jgi:hypothetical protein